MNAGIIIFKLTLYQEITLNSHCFPGCTKLLSMEVRSDGYFSQCTSIWKPFLEISFDRLSKITAVATQKGEEWVKPYKVGFMAGSRWRFVYSEYETQKVKIEDYIQ